MVLLDFDYPVISIPYWLANLFYQFTHPDSSWRAMLVLYNVVTAVATASWSTFEGTLELLHAPVAEAATYPHSTLKGTASYEIYIPGTLSKESGFVVLLLLLLCVLLHGLIGRHWK